jgi:hypothetical protein
MGMDVYGKKPANQVGEYFRRNVWGWRPLWQYVEDSHPEIASLVELPQSNDGDGLSAVKSKLLSRLIREDLSNGKAGEYVQTRNNYLASLERPNCDLCDGTGIRTDQVGVDNKMPERELSPEMASLTGRTFGYCNGCSGEGKKDAWETNYFLDLDDLEEFADFLDNCGGFEIC